MPLTLSLNHVCLTVDSVLIPCPKVISLFQHNPPSGEAMSKGLFYFQTQQLPCSEQFFFSPKFSISPHICQRYLDEPKWFSDHYLAWKSLYQIISVTKNFVVLFNSSHYGKPWCCKTFCCYITRVFFLLVFISLSGFPLSLSQSLTETHQTPSHSLPRLSHETCL